MCVGLGKSLFATDMGVSGNIVWSFAFDAVNGRARAAAGYTGSIGVGGAVGDKFSPAILGVGVLSSPLLVGFILEQGRSVSL